MRMTQSSLTKVLANHKKWVESGHTKGARADLSFSDCSGLNFHKANLCEANLSFADLTKANLSEANLIKADLTAAILKKARLDHANLKECRLVNAVLAEADLSYACLSMVQASSIDATKAKLFHANLYNAALDAAHMTKANLKKAYMKYVSMTNADLANANLAEADLFKADLEDSSFIDANMTKVNLMSAKCTDTQFTGANMTGVTANEWTINYFMACPETGEYIGWKKCVHKDDEYIVKLRIPENALRSSATSRKCRCSMAEVLEIQTLDGKRAKVRNVFSKYNSDFKYTVGKLVQTEFDTNRWECCTSGIHHFITREEALNYSF